MAVKEFSYMEGGGFVLEDDGTWSTTFTMAQGDVSDSLTVHGVPALSGGTVDGANDHRIVMAAAVAASGCTAPVTILGAQAVNKSYPDFFEVYHSLGGDLHVL